MEASETTTEKITLISDRRDPVYVIEPEDEVRNQRGRVMEKLQPTRLVFRDHQCEIASYDGPVQRLQGRAVIQGEVQGLTFEELVAIVEEHPKFGKRFWLAGKGPGDVEPSIEELRARIAGASKEELRELLEQERSTHNRRQAIELITDAALEVEPASESTEGAPAGGILGSWFGRGAEGGSQGADPGGGTDNV